MILVSNSIGEKNKKLAFIYYNEVSKIALAAWFLQLLVLTLGKKKILSLFTNDPEVL